MADNNDKYTQLKEQVENILDFCKKINEINPNHELYMDGRDIYVIHVKHVLSEVRELIDNIENEREPYYTKEWVEKSLEEADGWRKR